MEQHPIPQDVTGFQFKLIGTMTVKQFGYVALGAIFAVICWYAPLQGFLWQVITKGILMPLCGASGVIVAFVPIEGRPIDVMTMNFIHALFSPNQYVYIKKGRKFSFTQITTTKLAPAQTVQKPITQSEIVDKKEQQLRALLSESYKDSKSSIDKKELAFLQTFTPPAPQATPVSQPKPNLSLHQAPLPKLQPHAPVTITPTTPKVQPVHHEVPQTLQTGKPIPPAPQPPAPKPAPVIPQQFTPPMPKMPEIHNVSNGGLQPSTNKNPQLAHVPDTPNVIMGTVKDPRGNLLPNILIEIKDKDGTPVRAFKTNPLGQFASATPLANGQYTIELEDPKKQHAFNSIPVNATGQIMQPIEIISHDAREALRQALFN